MIPGRGGPLCVVWLLNTLRPYIVADFTIILPVLGRSHLTSSAVWKVVFVDLFRHSMVGCFLFEHIHSHCVRVVRNVLNMSSDLCVFVRVGYSTEKPENGSLFCVLTLVYYCCRCRGRSWSVYGA